jgi:hypothetical protein
MNFGGPSAAGFTDGLRAVFFNASVPSGCTLIIVLSKETASIRIWMSWACCSRYLQIREANVPALARETVFNESILGGCEFHALVYHNK